MQIQNVLIQNFCLVAIIRSISTHCKKIIKCIVAITEIMISREIVYVLHFSSAMF